MRKKSAKIYNIYNIYKDKKAGNVEVVTITVQIAQFFAGKLKVSTKPTNLKKVSKKC